MKRQKVAVIGSTGQLGTDLVEVLRQDDKFEVFPAGHADCDCTNANQALDVIRNLHPDVVINCAATVRVDDCEDHAREAFEVNAVGALNIARGCEAVDALCVYISTDYVFDGNKGSPYVESDPPCPINVYGASKLAGEYLVRQSAPRWLIVRMSSLFGKTGARGKGGNFVETTLSKAKANEALRIVNDVRMSPTFARDAAEAVRALIRSGITGLCHLANSGACTWHEFAKAILMQAGISKEVVPISSAELHAKARRPKDSSLRSDRIHGMLQYKLPPWQDALRAYLVEKEHIQAIGPALRDTR